MPALEEWSLIPARGGQNPAYRPSGIIVCFSRRRRQIRPLGGHVGLHAIVRSPIIRAETALIK